MEEKFLVCEPGVFIGTDPKTGDEVFRTECNIGELNKTFTIYQIHEISGEYEDYRDVIIGSYLRKERAEEVLKNLRDEEDKRRARAQKCRECPVREHDRELRSAINEYCEDFNEEYESDDGEEQLFCGNEYYSYSAYDDLYYEIEEVEVEE